MLVHKPKKCFGQHFLVNTRIADRIVEHAGIAPGDRILEIGPGRGMLTERLLEKGAAVTAVEIDHALAGFLKERFGSRVGFIFIEADILKLDLGILFQDSPGRIKTVSNLPYNISTPVIELLCRSRKLVSEAVLMVQREVARRILSSPGTRDYGLTTLNLALCAQGRRLMDVKPSAFNPPPKVMSRVISLVFSEELLYPLKDETVFRAVTGAAFRQRRKMVRNTLKPYLNSLGIADSEVYRMLETAGIHPEARPETIDAEQFVRLSNAVDRKLV